MPASSAARARPAAIPAPAPRLGPLARARRAAERSGRAGALRDAWRALWLSRLLVWTAGITGVLLLGRSPRWHEFDPDGVSAPFGTAGDLLVAPAVRWDSVWYLAVASDGYRGQAETAFFPLYPLLIRVAGAPLALAGGEVRGHVLAAMAISLVALSVALYVVHRLTEIELGPDTARLTVLLVALFPTAFAFSAVYTESLFLALSAGTVYAARLGRWPLAGVLGALAAATRSTGLLLLVPLVIMLVRGPRADAEPAAGRRVLRHRPGREGLWLALVPLGLAGYLGHLELATGEALSPFRVGDLWHREWAGPLAGAWEGAAAAWAGARQLLSGAREPVLFAAAGGDPFDVAAHNLGNFAFLLFAAVALVGALRRLPAAYGAWALVAMAVPLSYPVGPEPLASFPRYLAVLFPLHMWLAAWALERRGTRAVPAASAVLLVLLSAQFAAWEWVG